MHYTHDGANICALINHFGSLALSQAYKSDFCREISREMKVAKTKDRLKYPYVLKYPYPQFDVSERDTFTGRYGHSEEKMKGFYETQAFIKDLQKNMSRSFDGWRKLFVDHKVNALTYEACNDVLLRERPPRDVYEMLVAQAAQRYHQEKRLLLLAFPNAVTFDPRQMHAMMRAGAKHVIAEMTARQEEKWDPSMYDRVSRQLDARKVPVGVAYTFTHNYFQQLNRKLQSGRDNSPVSVEYVILLNVIEEGWMMKLSLTWSKRHEPALLKEHEWKLPMTEDRPVKSSRATVPKMRFAVDENPLMPVFAPLANPIPLE